MRVLCHDAPGCRRIVTANLADRAKLILQLQQRKARTLPQIGQTAWGVFAKPLAKQVMASSETSPRQGVVAEEGLPLERRPANSVPALPLR
jgi:hypothetical protein